eukprot:1786027-Prymnesium_polylepis.1
MKAQTNLWDLEPAATPNPILKCSRLRYHDKRTHGRHVELEWNLTSGYTDGRFCDTSSSVGVAMPTITVGGRGYKKARPTAEEFIATRCYTVKHKADTR